MKLKPLEQWYCDRCGALIESAKNGWLEWLIDDDSLHTYGFKIVHPGCSFYKDHANKQDTPLHYYSGPDGLVYLLALLDKGHAVDPDGKSSPCVQSIREWVELTRRLQTAHYEEARRLRSKAEQHGVFAEANEISPYMQSTLKQIIKEYGGAHS